MNQQEFEDTLRQLIRREPFIPFVVEMLNGERIHVNQPSVAFNAGAATHICESGIFFFECENVRQIRPLTEGAVA